MERMAGKLADKLVCREVIEECDRDFYQYAIESLLLYAVNAAVMTVSAICLGKVAEFGIFLAFFYPLRTHCGGFHLKKWYTCCIASCGIISFITMAAALVTVSWPILLFSSILCEAWIWKTAPCIHPNHPLEEEEVKQNRHKARRNSIVIWGIVILLKAMGLEEWAMLGWSAQMLNGGLMGGITVEIWN